MKTVQFVRACTFTVPLSGPGQRFRQKEGDVIELPDDVADHLYEIGLAAIDGVVPVVEEETPTLPSNVMTGPFAATPVEQPTQADERVSRFEPPARPGGLRGFINKPR